MGVCDMQGMELPRWEADPVGMAMTAGGRQDDGPGEMDSVRVRWMGRGRDVAETYQHSRAGRQ